MAKIKKVIKRIKKKHAATNLKKTPRKKKITKKAVKKKVLTPPKGYQSITPYLIVSNAAKAITFYKAAFNAKELMRMEHGGKIGHAELKIGDAKIMLADEHPEMYAKAPESEGETSVSIHLYIKDVDGVVNKAVSLGAKLVRSVENMFYGDRCGTLEDPYGHKWHVATHIEDVTPAKMKKRMEEFKKNKNE